ncbi:MAG TPA: methylenetetrahydrofolate reductase C-terminal domain-containing protein [Spirochaetia bacterium]|nr:methylenetetrahydrofolate reductase C-terminal domain-containing protein [Spirochaetia bacterium]
MIVAEQKPLAEIADMIKDCRKVLFAGCGGCVTVCLSGGEKETEVMATALRMKRQLEGNPLETVTYTATRQCDPEYIDAMADAVRGVDAVVSLACGVGPQYIAARYPDLWVIPAQNTTFAGGSKEHGVWEEFCGLCGQCVLHLTGGICPIIRCSKSILNGPCGGSQYGKCEISKDVDCAWHLIYERLKRLDRLDLIRAYQEPKDWSKARDGGPRKVTREDVMIG